MSKLTTQQQRDLKSLNAFVRKVEADMTEQEYREWMALQEFERKAIAYAAWSVLTA